MGGTVFWMPNFNYPAFLEYHRRLKISFCLTVPPICLLIANDSNVRDHFNDLKFAIAGAAPMGPELQDAVSAKFGHGKTMVTQTYGMSEVAGSTTCLAYGEKDMTASVGRLLQNLDARIVNENDIDVEPGQEGELLLNGLTVFKGYHKAPPSSDVFDSNGWFRTGDIVRFEKGLFYLVDRKKELIKYKGNQVALAELEGFLLSHPQILDAAVIGVASKGTEVPKGYVVARDGDVSAEHILSFIKERVSNHKQLRSGVVFVDQIPKSPSGKILRRVLKDMSRADSKAKGAKL
ncbi:hypothetical protein VE00_02360 [Pseudogymnoascus sp. WSF 3629]|nr:hypothetical protein VE00_02360 [Pseudogymnoascus sp. WSF 3629]